MVPEHSYTNASTVTENSVWVSSSGQPKLAKAIVEGKSRTPVPGSASGSRAANERMDSVCRRARWRYSPFRYCFDGTICSTFTLGTRSTKN